MVPMYVSPEYHPKMIPSSFADIFPCRSCGFWYTRDEEGPGGLCKCCFWGLPVNRKAIVTRAQAAVLMARELEELLAK